MSRVGVALSAAHERATCRTDRRRRARPRATYNSTGSAVTSPAVDQAVVVVSAESTSWPAVVARAGSLIFYNLCVYKKWASVHLYRTGLDFVVKGTRGVECTDFTNLLPSQRHKEMKLGTTMKEIRSRRPTKHARKPPPLLLLLLRRSRIWWRHCRRLLLCILH